jgi:hypothetical protein
MSTTVYLLKAPVPGGGSSVAVGCVLLQDGARQEFFVSQPEAGVWRDIVQEFGQPAEWRHAAGSLRGYEVEDHRDGRDFATAYRVWSAYVALSWDTKGGIPLPEPG